jgi:hypothetical protein
MKQTGVHAQATRGAARRWLEFSLGFLCIFAGLSLPLPGLARLWVWAHAAIGNALLPESLSSGVELTFRTPTELLADKAWSLTLLVQPSGSPVISVPIDLRTLAFLPTACLVALALATPLPSRRDNVKLLGIGLLILLPLLMGLMSLPVITLLGGTGSIHAFDLGLTLHTVLEILYRALVAPPGMAYGIPLLVWWLLVVWLGAGGNEPREARQ